MIDGVVIAVQFKPKVSKVKSQRSKVKGQVKQKPSPEGRLVLTFDLRP